jgi:hypothetical protein
VNCTALLHDTISCWYVAYLITSCKPKFRSNFVKLKNYCYLSQSPSGLRNELSSLARTMGSWVRIPLEAWMSVYVYSSFVLSCMQVAALRRADHSSKESYRVCEPVTRNKLGCTSASSPLILVLWLLTINL